MVQFASYSRRALCKMHLIFRRINGPIDLPKGQVKFFEEFKLQKYCEINLLIKTFLGLVKMMFRLVNVSFSLHEWQAVKMTFFAPWVFKQKEKK